MHCCQYYMVTGDGDPAFTIELPQFSFGEGCLAEAGPHAKALGLKRAALFTDKRVGQLPHIDAVKRALREAGVDFVVYDEVQVEPTDASFARQRSSHRRGDSRGSSPWAAVRSWIPAKPRTSTRPILPISSLM